MKTDRELLELAAKAAGVVFTWKPKRIQTGPADTWGVRPYREEQWPFLRAGLFWNPLTDDGDALRLAVKLGLPTGFDDRFKQLGNCAYATYPTSEDSCDSILQSVDEAGGEAAAMRRAIVRAAAAIGEAMQ